MAKPLKVGVRASSSPKNSRPWSVLYLKSARDAAERFLDKSQYAHAADLFKALAEEEDPAHPLTQRVESIENFFELKDKGGILGKINLRVFFAIDYQNRAIVVLHAFKKEAEGQTPDRIKTLVRIRLRALINGQYGPLS